MRYKSSTSEKKIFWLNEGSGRYRIINGFQLDVVGSATWLDKRAPRAVFTIEDVVYNVDVHECVRANWL